MSILKDDCVGLIVAGIVRSIVNLGKTVKKLIQKYVQIISPFKVNMSRVCFALTSRNNM